MNFQSPRRFANILLLPVFCLVLLAGCDSTYNHVVSIAVTPVGPSIGVGKTQQFMATATYNNKKTADITSQVTWASDAMGVATITSAGLATGVSAGTANITATLGTVVSPKDVLTVTSAATLVSIAITPNPPPASVAIAGTLQLTATGTYSDTSTKDLTSQVTWTSMTPAVATISAGGLVTGVAVGTSNITAMLSGVTSPLDVITVTTTSVTLTSITVSPASPTIPVGGTADFIATGHYSDGSSQILSAATWSSLTPTTASVTSLTFTNTATPPVTTSVGHALGVAASATAVTIKATSGTVSGTASLTVSSAVARNAYVAGGTDNNAVTYAFNAATAGLLPIASGNVTGQPTQIIPEPSGRFAFVLRTTDIATASIDPSTGRLSGLPSVLATSIRSNFGVVDPTGQFLYVASSGATTSTLNSYLISLVDGSLSPIGTPITIGTTPSSLISVITDRAGKYVYAVDNVGGNVYAFSIGAGGVLTALATPNYATGTSPQYPAIDPSNTFLFIPNQGDGITGGDSISAFTIHADGSLTAVAGSPFSVTSLSGPTFAAVDATGKFLFVTEAFINQVSSFPLTAGAPGANVLFPAGITPVGIAVDPTNTSVAVVNEFGNTVSTYTLNAATGALTPAVPLPLVESPAGPIFINFGIGTAPLSVSPGAVFAANSVSGDISAFTSSPGTGVLTAAASSPFTGQAGNSIAAADLQGAFLFTGSPAGVQIDGFSVNQTTAALTALAGSPLFAAGNHTDLPSALGISPTDAFAYALDVTSGSVVPYTLSSATTVSGPGTAIAAFVGASNLASDPQGDFIWVLGSNATNGILPFTTYNPGGTIAVSAEATNIPDNWISGAVDGSGQFLVAVDKTTKKLQSFSITLAGTGLGTDGALTAVGTAVTLSSTGPSWVVAFDPLDRVVYVADQTAGTITPYPFDVTTGLLGAAGTVTTVSANGITQISTDITGSYLYVGVNAAAAPGSKGAIAVYKIGAAGSLTAVAGSPFTTGTGNPGIAVTNVVQ
jgi:6-phosphogluconolactonase (cycloisomerase 2 family)